MRARTTTWICSAIRSRLMEVLVFLLPFFVSAFLLIFFREQTTWWEHAVLIVPSLLVDSGFTGEVAAIVKTYDVRSLGVKRVFIPKGTKVAQMRLAEVPDTELTLGTIEKDTERGEGRFNHTGW